MPKVTRYIVISDAGIEIPRPPTPTDPGGNDAHFRFSIESPAPATNIPAVLFFRVNPKKLPVRLRVRINQDVVLDQEFDTDPQRSWHEAYTPGNLKTGGNELIVSVPITSEGTAWVSDFVLFFQSVVP